MSKIEVLQYMKHNPFKRFKLDWWNDYMYFYFNGKDFMSGGKCIMDIKFLLDGHFIKAKSDNELLGGLFDVKSF